MMNCNLTASVGMADTVRVFAVDYHRNGISGEEFHVVLMRLEQPGREPRTLVATVFGRKKTIAVIDPELAAKGLLGPLYDNMWRGDDLEPICRKAIRQHDDWIGRDDHVWVRRPAINVAG